MLQVNWDHSPARGDRSNTVTSKTSRTVGNIDLQLLDFGEKNKKLVSSIRSELLEACEVQEYLERREEQFKETLKMESNKKKRPSKVIKRVSKINKLLIGEDYEAKSKAVEKQQTPEEITHSPAIKKAQIIQNLDSSIIDMAVLSPTSVLHRIKVAQQREYEEQERLRNEKREERRQQELLEEQEQRALHENRMKQSSRPSQIPQKKKKGGWGQR